MRKPPKDRLTIIELKTGKNPWVLDEVMNGERTRRGFKTEKEAEAARRDRIETLKAHGTQADLPHVYRAMVVDALEQWAARASRKGNLPECLVVYKQYLDQIEKSVPFSEFAARFRAKLDQRGRDQTLKLCSIRSQQIALRRLENKFGDRKVCTITQDEIEEWVPTLRNKMTGKQLGLVSRTEFVKLATTIFNYAVEWHYTQTNPAKKIKRETAVPQKKDRMKFRILSYEQTKRLLYFTSVYDPEMMPFLILRALTGTRTTHIHRIDWSDIKLEDAKIVFEADATKLQKRHTIYLHPVAVKWLKAYEQPSGTLIAVSRAYGRRGGGPLSIKGVQDRVKVIARIAGLPRIVKNAFRSTFMTMDMEHGRNAHETASRTNSSPKMLEETYLDVVDYKQAVQYIEQMPLPSEAQKQKIAEEIKATGNERPVAGRPLGREDDPSKPRKVYSHVTGRPWGRPRGSKDKTPRKTRLQQLPREHQDTLFRMHDVEWKRKAKADWEKRMGYVEEKKRIMINPIVVEVIPINVKNGQRSGISA